VTADSIRFSAIVLAAGTSSRMQGRNKLLLSVGGEPLIRGTVRNVLEARPQETVVVTGFQGPAVSEALAGLPVVLRSNPRFADGQMTSVAAGAAALQKATDAVMVCLGDMVLLSGADYRELIDALARLAGPSILVPHYLGQRGNPVVLAAWHLPDLVAERRNPGCRNLIENCPEEVVVHEVAHDRFVFDLDTPDDYDRLLVRSREAA